MPDPRVTLIEDNALNSRLIQKVLQTSGFYVEVYDNAEDALGNLNGDMPDLILLDLQLPGMNGYEFARRLRTMSDYQSVPIVAVSANIRPEDKEVALESGCNGFITKPINTRTLVQQIKGYIREA